MSAMMAMNLIMIIHAKVSHFISSMYAYFKNHTSNCNIISQMLMNVLLDGITAVSMLTASMALVVSHVSAELAIVEME